MRIYFSGIGGVGIGPLAEIAKSAGYDIVGSDATRGLMSQQLEADGVRVSYDQSGEFFRAEHNIVPFDWFVYTAALSDDHPELASARALGIRTAKRDELLAYIILEKNLKLIAVSGTHGKTTTTGMLIWTIQQLGIPVSYAIGTTLSFGPSGYYDPASEYFIYECDEFDRNFLHFSPHLSVITSIDYDHPDTYPTEADYTSAFRQFVQKSDMTVMWQKDANYIDSRGPSTWALQENEVVSLRLAGEHNRRNGTLVLKTVERLGLAASEDSAFPAGASQDNQQIAASGSLEEVQAQNATTMLDSFPGTDRRFEKLADNLYSDYGHHPVEIAATLQMARELSDHVVLVYQPHQNIRQHDIKGEYTDLVFTDAAEIYWLPTYLSREDPTLEILSPETLSNGISRVTIADLDNSLWDNITYHQDAGHLVLCMGAGTIDEWVRDELQKLH